MKTKYDIGQNVFVITKCKNVIVSRCNSECRNICPFEDDCEIEECCDTQFKIFDTEIDTIFITDTYEHYGFKDLSECGIESEEGQYPFFTTLESANQYYNKMEKLECNC